MSTEKPKKSSERIFPRQRMSRLYAALGATLFIGGLGTALWGVSDSGHTAAVYDEYGYNPCDDAYGSAPAACDAYRNASWEDDQAFSIALEGAKLMAIGGPVFAWSHWRERRPKITTKVPSAEAAAINWGSVARELELLQVEYVSNLPVSPQIKRELPG